MFNFIVIGHDVVDFSRPYMDEIQASLFSYQKQAMAPEHACTTTWNPISDSRGEVRRNVH